MIIIRQSLAQVTQQGEKPRLCTRRPNKNIVTETRTPHLKVAWDFRNRRIAQNNCLFWHVDEGPLKSTAMVVEDTTKHLPYRKNVMEEVPAGADARELISAVLDNRQHVRRGRASGPTAGNERAHMDITQAIGIHP